jgi:predicted transcriptional regulator
MGRTTAERIRELNKQGLSNKDIASDLQVTPAAVASALYRDRKKAAIKRMEGKEGKEGKGKEGKEGKGNKRNKRNK